MTYSSLVLTVPNNAPDNLRQRYLIYIACADNGKGIDITTGHTLKTFTQWLQS
jgi:transposase